jgi:hypothetical protein
METTLVMLKIEAAMASISDGTRHQGHRCGSSGAGTQTNLIDKGTSVL